MVALPIPLSTSPGTRAQESAGRLVNCFAEPKGEEAGFKIIRAPAHVIRDGDRRLGFPHGGDATLLMVSGRMADFANALMGRGVRVPGISLADLADAARFRTIEPHPRMPTLGDLGRLLAPDLMAYLTEPPPPIPNLPETPGKVPSADDPREGPALMDAVSLATLALPGGAWAAAIPRAARVARTTLPQRPACGIDGQQERLVV